VDKAKVDKQWSVERLARNKQEDGTKWSFETF
jgi:hypothetical protein